MRLRQHETRNSRSRDVRSDAWAADKTHPTGVMPRSGFGGTGDNPTVFGAPLTMAS